VARYIIGLHWYGSLRGSDRERAEGREEVRWRSSVRKKSLVLEEKSRAAAKA